MIDSHGYWLSTVINNTRAIRKVTPPRVNLTKQAMRQKLLYKNTCILKLVVLLSVVTARIEALVLGNKFLYACVSEVCRL
jgi:hypothetical protein